MTFTFNNGLVEVEAVEVECHGGDAEGGKPDAHDGPRCQEEMERARVVKGCILENQSSEVAVSCDDVVSLFFLTKFVAIVMRLGFSRLSNKAACDQASVHSTKERPTKYTSHAKHVERMHENIMFSLEYQHVIEGSANTKRHAITKTTLTEGVDEKYCGCSGDRVRYRRP